MPVASPGAWAINDFLSPPRPVLGESFKYSRGVALFLHLGLKVSLQVFFWTFFFPFALGA